MRRWFAIGAFVAAFGCQTVAPPVSLVGSAQVTADDYEQALDDWTREDRVYDRLESKIFATATFHSPAFRKAFLIRHPEVFGPGSDEASRLALTSEGAEDFFEFFLSATTTDETWNDFDEDDSIWRITLTADDGRNVRAASIKKVKVNANLKTIYPYITDYSSTYSVRFPRTDETGSSYIAVQSKFFVLELSSSIAKATLRWDLEP